MKPRKVRFGLAGVSLFLLSLLLGACDLQGGGKGGGGFTVVDKKDYQVSAGAGEERQVGNLTLRFPEGFSGTLSLGRVTNGPLRPESKQTIWLAIPEGQRVQIVLQGEFLDWSGEIKAGKSYPVVLKYDRVSGSIDDKGPRERWVYVPAQPLPGGRVAFDVTLNSYVQALGTQFTKAGEHIVSLEEYVLDPVKAALKLTLRTKVLVTYSNLRDRFLEALPPDLKARVEANLRRVSPNMTPPFYHDGGNYYQGFYYLASFIPIFSPRIYINLTETDINTALVHEISHFLVHMLVGDKVQADLEAGAPGPEHAIGTTYDRSKALIEDYAFVLQAFFGEDQNLGAPGPGPFISLSPKRTDMASVEGFRAALLIRFAENATQITDLETRKRISLPPLNGSWEKVFRILAEGHTDATSLARRLEEVSGGAFAFLAAASGWRYEGKGKLVDATGSPLKGASLRQLRKLEGTPYYSEASGTSGNDGSFTLYPLLAGPSELEVRAQNPPAEGRVPISVDWGLPTNKVVDLGTLSLAQAGLLGTNALSIALRSHGTIKYTSLLSDGKIEIKQNEPFLIRVRDERREGTYRCAFRRETEYIAIPIEWNGTSFEGRIDEKIVSTHNGYTFTATYQVHVTGRVEFTPAGPVVRDISFKGFCLDEAVGEGHARREVWLDAGFRAAKVGNMSFDEESKAFVFTEKNNLAGIVQDPSYFELYSSENYHFTAELLQWTPQPKEESLVLEFQNLTDFLDPW